MVPHVESGGRWRVVPNGVVLGQYKFQIAVPKTAPLVFLGRMEEIKGPHLAIQIARRAGVPLILAGNIPLSEQMWFDAHVAPFVDGSSVCYIGPVDDTAKNRLLGQALALLMPIVWDEPFGIVMTEALACGTPVLGFGRGSIPEVIEEGVTGFICSHIDGLVDSVARIGSLDRAACRRSVERKFSSEVIVDQYLSAYTAHASVQERL